MKLRNMKTGKIAEVITDKIEINTLIGRDNVYLDFESLADLNEEWEDYEEPEEVWYIDFQGMIRSASKEENDWFKESEIGNYFETKEEAEKAVEKLKAWKRLKDKGFKFEWWLSEQNGDHIEFYMDSFEWDKEATEDLNLLFGGKEWINSEL